MSEGALVRDEYGRPEPPVTGTEAETLLGFLEYQRATFAWKTGGLDAAGLRATVGPSAMTLGGMVKHLAYVEQWWFGHSLHGDPPTPPWDAVDWAADRDWEWNTATGDAPDDLREAMVRSHYGLQALLYLVALHRYLRWRLRGYAPERHLGGAAYLFLRGMDGTGSGVFGWQPPAALVVATSDLLDRGGSGS